MLKNFNYWQNNTQNDHLSSLKVNDVKNYMQVLQCNSEMRRMLISPIFCKRYKVAEKEEVIWPHEITCPWRFPVYMNMAFQQTCGLPVCKATLCFLFTLCVLGEGQYKGFRKFTGVQDARQRDVFEQQWFTQKLDHFNGADSRVWKQVSLFMCCVSPDHASPVSCHMLRNIPFWLTTYILMQNWPMICPCLHNPPSLFSFLRGTLWIKPSTSQVAQCFWW